MKFNGKTVTIDEKGFVISSDSEFKDFWSSQAGEWKIVSTAPGLIILERRVGNNYEGASKVLISGEIKKEGWLVDIINFICNSRWSGTLTATSGELLRKLFFDKGAVRMGSSNVESEKLGEIMVKEGLIKKAQLLEALEEVSGEKRLGEILIRKSICTASDIFRVMYRQVEEIFHSTLLMSSGYFYFTEGLEAAEIPAILSLDTHALLLEVVKKMDEISYFKKRIPGVNIILKRKRISFPPGIPQLEADFLGKCDGRRTLMEIAREIRVGEFEAMKLAYRYIEEGAVEVVITERSYDESIRFAVWNYNSIIDIIHQTAKQKGVYDSLSLIERNYLNTAAEEGELPEGIVINSDGHIEPESAVNAAAKLKTRNRMGYIIQAMNRYVFFILFTVCTYLPREEQQRLNTQVHTLIQKVSS